MDMPRGRFSSRGLLGSPQQGNRLSLYAVTACLTLAARHHPGPETGRSGACDGTVAPKGADARGRSEVEPSRIYDSLPREIDALSVLALMSIVSELFWKDRAGIEGFSLPARQGMGTQKSLTGFPVFHLGLSFLFADAVLLLNFAD